MSASADFVETERLLDIAGDAPRTRLALLLVAAQLMLEVFDFYIIGFLVSVIGPAWRLTYGQTSIVLLAGGLGAVFGSLLCGRLADRFGRKPTFVGCALVYSAAAGLIALVPDGNWPLIAALRFVVGGGFGGAGLAQITYVSEIVPRSKRILLGGLVQVPISLGLLLASISASALLPALGWRGLAALGMVPFLFALLQLWVSPESIRWQIASGRGPAARHNAAQLLKRPVPALLLPEAPDRPTASKMRTLLLHPRQCALVMLMFLCGGIGVNGVLLWGPTLVAALLRETPAQAAHAFIYVSLAGIVGRFAFTWLPGRVGRKHTGEIMGYGGAAVLAVAAFGHDTMLFGAPLFLLAIVVSALFFDGGYAHLQPYGPELFPTPIAASGAGLGQAAGGLAKLGTPVILAAIAGVTATMNAETTRKAALPAMLFVAGGMLALGVAFTLLAEPQRRREARGGLASLATGLDPLP